jgi:hypothetical protein
VFIRVYYCVSPKKKNPISILAVLCLLGPGDVLLRRLGSSSPFLYAALFVVDARDLVLQKSD